MFEVISKLKLYGSSACDATILLSFSKRYFLPLSTCTGSVSQAVAMSRRHMQKWHVQCIFFVFKTCFCLTTVSIIMIIL